MADLHAESSDRGGPVGLMIGNLERMTTAPSLSVDASPQDRRCCNVAGYLPQMAESNPDRAAVIVTASRKGGEVSYQSWTYSELERASNRCANALAGGGIRRGMRVLMMVRPGHDFVCLTFALFKMGAVPILIDPGMGVGRMLDCIRMVEPEAFVGIPLAQLVRLVRRGAFRSVRHTITVGRGLPFGGHTLNQLMRDVPNEFQSADTASDEVAAILFTSGSTGPAKGVVYEHGMFDAQVRQIQSHYGIEPGEVDMPTFPLFALFSVAMGMTCVVPDMNPSRPAQAKPERIVEAIQRHRVTNSFGSPALWRRVADYCNNNNVCLSSLRRVLIAGAPVRGELIEDVRRILGPDADVHTPYGATESLPICSISGSELVGDCAEKSRQGAGICVGRELPGMRCRLIGISDGAIEHWSDELEVPIGQRGEIVVTGEVVTKAYHGQPQATRLAKISEHGQIVHRMGDLGYRDADGRLWFCGRKAHRVITADQTLLSVCCEAIFNRHPRVARTALVGVGNAGSQTPVMVVELIEGRRPKRREAAVLRDELRSLAETSDQTNGIHTFLFHTSLPVDVRHNAKINREQLADWAKRKLA